MSARLSENKVMQDLELIVHAAKHPQSEEHLLKLDVAYQKKLGVLARFGHPDAFSRYLQLYYRRFPTETHPTYVN